MDSSTSVIEGRESERAGDVEVKGSRRERGPSVRTTFVRVSACNLMISSRNFDDAGSAGRAERGRGRERGGWDGRERRGRCRNARPEERTSERGRELVRAGVFPLANSYARVGLGERGIIGRDRRRLRAREREEERKRDGRNKTERKRDGAR